MLSVNTNSGALSALRNLEANHKWLETLQERIATGYKVGSVTDDAATYSIAQRMRGDLAGLNAAIGSIDRATVAVDVAVVATESISDILIEMKGKMASLVSARENGDESAATAYTRDLDAYRDQIKTIISSATFNGTNLIDHSNGVISALANSDGSDTIDFDHQDLSFGGALITLTDDSDYSMAELENSIDNVNAAMSHFGTASRRLEIQKEFTNKLHNVIEEGIGRLVDADLARTAADLQAAQIKEQLGITALSIANQAPRSLLTLFGLKS
ncbi:flagellin [Kordiimonas aestuarii]|uniref:flagellin n=1 Tax=Kordiimonas aestuarii TaxID=1005925 RepID=UPI0021D08F20|nr:flagellin [Kordiimonas aestuarii]